MNAVSTKLIF